MPSWLIMYVAANGNSLVSSPFTPCKSKLFGNVRQRHRLAYILYRTLYLQRFLHRLKLQILVLVFQQYLKTCLVILELVLKDLRLLLENYLVLVVIFVALGCNKGTIHHGTK